MRVHSNVRRKYLLESKTDEDTGWGWSGYVCCVKRKKNLSITRVINKKIIFSLEWKSSPSLAQSTLNGCGNYSLSWTSPFVRSKLFCTSLKYGKVQLETFDDALKLIRNENENAVIGVSFASFNFMRDSIENNLDEALKAICGWEVEIQFPFLEVVISTCWNAVQSCKRHQIKFNLCNHSDHPGRRIIFFWENCWLKKLNNYKISRRKSN